jgi:hypothetical protein
MLILNTSARVMMLAWPSESTHVINAAGDGFTGLNGSIFVFFIVCSLNKEEFPGSNPEIIPYLRFGNISELKMQN